jgi:TonB family protein
MGKIVKYCVSCDEGFAEKFGFCPTCGAQLQSFEMNPVEASSPVENTPAEETVYAAPAEPAIAEPEIPAPLFMENAPVEEPEEVLEAASETEQAAVEEPFEEITPEPVKEEVPAAAAASSFANYYEPAAAYNEPAFSSPDRVYNKKDDGYYVTVIQEKNAKQRNTLLLGATALMLILTVGGTVYSLFNKDLQVGAIDNGDLFAFVPVVEDVPMEVEQEKKKKDDDGGGGGGGGHEEDTPTSQGRLASQTEKPLLAPDKSAVQMKTDLQMIASTQGNRIIQPTLGPYGDPNSKYYIPSNGTGTGSGQGSGSGSGQGSGRGTGMGSGDGSGSGSGEGNGNGNGRGDGSGTSSGPPPPPVAVGVTQSVKILSKPRASYTDAARQNNVQGSVTLRITFLASGQIGSISPVSGLPYGLTEQAIAAARAIRFEPAKRNGVPQTKQMTIQYGFTIY